jgi:hypothetical protein
MEAAGAEAYLVNTGWNGTGKRISIKDTRGIIDAILDGSIEKAPTKVLPVFNLEVPTELPGVNPAILDPRDTYADQAEWDAKAADLAQRAHQELRALHRQRRRQTLVAAGRSCKKRASRLAILYRSAQLAGIFLADARHMAPAKPCLDGPCALDSAKLYTIYNFATCP